MTTDDDKDRELFHAFLEENSKIVASWPEWKRNMLGLVVNDADHARLQVPDATVDESHGGSENVEAIAALHQQIRDMPHLSNHPDFRRVYRHLLDTEETQELHTEAERFNRQLNARLEQQFKVDALAAVGLASHPKADQIWTFIDQRCCGPEGGGIHWYTRDVALDSLVALARLMK